MSEFRTRVRVNLRLGRPSTAAPRAGTLEAGVSFVSMQVVDGEEVAGENTWHLLEGERYVWHGGCEPVGVEGSLQDSEDPDVDRPNMRELGDVVPPVLHTARGVRHRVQGRRPSGLEGLIVHFDSYRIRRAGNGEEDSDRRTLDMMAAGQNNGYHYLEISRTGKIYAPEGFAWHDWGAHAGTSECPVTGRTGVSRFYLGVEMNNPGVVYPAQEADVFCPWFNSRRHPPGHARAGQVLLDARGRCSRLSENDEWYATAEVRRASGENIHDHFYMPYTFDQFEALANLAVYLARTFPSSFKLDQVLGHDEVAPRRKDDPGGALAHPGQIMTMPQFREHLKSIT